jgi:hypothetical protein
MTTSVPPSRGPSQLVDVRAQRPHLEPGMLARADKPANPTTLTLPGVRRRGPRGEAIVVIANPPPFSQLIISFQQDRERTGPSGVSVAVQAIPCFGEAEDEDSATRVFDRQSVMPGLFGDGHESHAPQPGHALAAPAPVTAVPSVPSGPSQEELRDAARAAQDTYRYMASNAQRDAGPMVSRWLLVPVACLVASACALVFLHMRDDAPVAAPLASVVPKVALELPAAVVHEVHMPELPVTRPETPRPSEPRDERPSARIDLDGLGLEVTSTPWMELFIDGKPMGHTPQRGLTLSPGEHDVMLLNRDLGLETHAFVHAERGTLETQEIAFE